MNLSDVQSEIDALTERMTTVIEQSTFNGVSMVDNTDTLTVVTGVSRRPATVARISLSTRRTSAGSFTIAMTPQRPGSRELSNDAYSASTRCSSSTSSW